MRAASIDIGTNTILMLIAERDGNGKLNKIHEEYDVARLGEDLDKTHIIKEDAITRTIEILKRYKGICDSYSVDRIYPVATSAMRDAKNKDEVSAEFYKTLGYRTEIISGEEEAKLSFLGSVDNNNDSILIDIGGGSTEIITSLDGEINAKSFQIGAVRITEKFFTSQPVKDQEIANASNYINNLISEISDFKNIESIYAVAGTATTIALTAMGYPDHEVEKADNFLLTQKLLNSIFMNYKNSDSQTIITKYKIHPRRADLITAGALILKNVIEQLEKRNIRISSKGLRYGILESKI